MSKLENKTSKSEQNKDDDKMPFGRDNYLWVLIGIAFIFIGFILMIGDKAMIYSCTLVYTNTKRKYRKSRTSCTVCEKTLP